MYCKSQREYYFLIPEILWGDNVKIFLSVLEKARDFTSKISLFCFSNFSHCYICNPIASFLLGLHSRNYHHIWGRRSATNSTGIIGSRYQFHGFICEFSGRPLGFIRLTVNNTLRMFRWTAPAVRCRNVPSHGQG